MTQQILLPLLEGMALFQEFDAFPGGSRVLSTPAFWASFLFRPLEEDPQQLSDAVADSECWTSRVRNILIQYRTSEKALHRKVDVLMRSISNDTHHYLTGYLSVKQIWLSASRNTPAFIDRDLFLCFLKDWIFQDWVLIDYLTDPILECETVCYLVSERIQTRLIQLSTTNLTKEVTVYEEESDTKQSDPTRLLWSLRLLQEEVLQGQERLQIILNEVIVGVDGGEHNNWYFSDMLTLTHRQTMMRLSLELVEIETNEYNRLIVRKTVSTERKNDSIGEILDIYLSAPAPIDAELGVTPGWMTVYFLPEYLSVVVLALRENQPMLSVPSTGIPNDKLDMLRFAVAKVVSTESTRRELTRLGYEQLERLDDIYYNTPLKEFSEHVRQIYTFYALNLVSEEHVAEVEVMMSQKGLYQILGKNGDLLNALAKITLVAPMLGASNREAVYKITSREGIELDSVLLQLHKRQEETGMKLLFEKDGVTLFLV
ncbi:hypothetical protein [Phormidium tenue]|uniref:Uncharacterized protein n=1 Tax=Phormidium tenue FACHB-1050 TaxID=2692857 RepID=A0ABR8CBL5_9CYAN|nr:hypothetical protein [Phormidium tenue]MBD2318054.1 hypothetical protein [Phormidium tenue FACHB-1050]